MVELMREKWSVECAELTLYNCTRKVTHTAPGLFEQFPTELPGALCLWLTSAYHSEDVTHSTTQGRSHYFNRGMWDVFIQLI